MRPALRPRSQPPRSWPTKGHKALDVWDLGQAATGFRQAIAHDTGFAHAYVDLAQVLAWAETPVEQWRAAAARAVHLADRLGPRDRTLALALSAMATDRLVDACAEYRALVARDSLDATAWYGLAECQARDDAVVRDGASPSGWSFRSSFHSAGLAYRRALELAPSASRRGERAVARRWASAVRALWANADPELGPTIRRMEEM